VSNETTSLSIRTALQRHADAMARRRAAAGRLLSLTDSEILAVEHLARAGALTPAQLTARLQLTSGGTTALIRRLEHAGHVVRDPHPSDRRSVVLRLTPVIERRVSALLSPGLDLDRVVAELDDDERRAVTRVLDEVAELAEQHAERLAGEAAASAAAALEVPVPARWS
jgi:DNA-binding MarR family transcriptional regulator